MELYSQVFWEGIRRYRMDVDDVFPSKLSLCSTFSPDSLRTIVKGGVSLTWTSLTIWARPCCSVTGSHSLVRAACSPYCSVMENSMEILGFMLSSVWLPAGLVMRGKKMVNVVWDASCTRGGLYHCPHTTYLLCSEQDRPKS